MPLTNVGTAGAGAAAAAATPGNVAPFGGTGAAEAPLAATTAAMAEIAPAAAKRLPLCIPAPLVDAYLTESFDVKWPWGKCERCGPARRSLHTRKVRFRCACS